ncbi:B3 domain-containing protein At2g33720 [Sesamum indicum]|uniref:B3 domain-containing protein At2g33720 n=1 Tax=Sesamum indicum TaxID=4182 RepID=A0A6I9TVY7_SESIN|nr:B3 domain-containing protein At2g33720 [Sesamum indicum]
MDHPDWPVTKRLRVSDVDNSARCLLEKSSVKEHILPHLRDNDMLKLWRGVEVVVWDVDTESEHVLVLRRWKSSGSYVLHKNWLSDFVMRRGLEMNDVIGLRWDDENSRLEFKLLQKNLFSSGPVWAGLDSKCPK